MNNFFDILMSNLSEDKIIAADILSNISVELANYRINNNLNQKDMAKLLNVSQPMISKYESGSYNFTVKTLCEIACKLGFDINCELRAESSNNFSSKNNINIVKESKKSSNYTNFFDQKQVPLKKICITNVA